ncbi:MAG TPA: DUF5674 family protein [Elusimicrobiota bacterium]|jgi:Protein of unknown function (DUF5674)|nr:DUF5674 family protein [Elusimicrobiota bacterium]
MEIKLVDKSLPLSDVAAMAKDQFGEMIKATVDVERELLALGGDLHSDEEALLLESGSKQEHLWGINIYPGNAESERVEFDSMINVRPSQNNRSRGVEDPAIRERILRVVKSLIRA